MLSNNEFNIKNYPSLVPSIVTKEALTPSQIKAVSLTLNNVKSTLSGIQGFKVVSNSVKLLKCTDNNTLLLIVEVNGVNASISFTSRGKVTTSEVSYNETITALSDSLSARL